MNSTTPSVRFVSQQAGSGELFKAVAPDLALKLDTQIDILSVPDYIVKEVSNALTEAMTIPNNFKTIRTPYTQPGLSPINFTVSSFGQGLKPNLTVTFEDDKRENSVTGQSKPINYFPKEKPEQLKKDIESLLGQVVRAKHAETQSKLNQELHQERP